MYGTAVDLRIGDLNGDGRVTIEDRRPVEACVESIDSNPALQDLHGWMSDYPEPSLLHCDCRGSS
jgi:hypothetical protein